MDIEEFYDADPRRRQSAEVEFGRDWSDDRGGRSEISWVADTGELYVMNEPIEPIYSDGLGDVELQRVNAKDMTVEILAVVPTRAAVDAMLGGWQDAMGTGNSVVRSLQTEPRDHHLQTGTSRPAHPDRRFPDARIHRGSDHARRPRRAR